VTEANRSPTPAEERVGELTRLAGGLAHELRNPLSTLMINLTLLAEDIRAAEPIDPHVQRRCLQKIDTINAEANRLNHLFDDFLRLVGPCALDCHAEDINRIAARVVEFVGAQTQAVGVCMRSDFAAGPLVCPVDAEKLEQALLNIVANALAAMAGGGDLMVRTRSEGTWAVIEISDTGHGMDPETQARVFDPFFSTRKRGTGLGLSTTRRIIRDHGGTIQLHSETGRGTSFTIRMPLAAAAGG
jgi:signal transduction histidine kinase